MLGGGGWRLEGVGDDGGRTEGRLRWRWITVRWQMGVGVGVGIGIAVTGCRLGDGGRFWGMLRATSLGVGSSSGSSRRSRRAGLRHSERRGERAGRKGNGVGIPAERAFDRPENRSGCLQGFRLFACRVWTCLEPRAVLEDAKRAGLSRCQAKGWKTLRCVSPVACAKAWTDGQISLLAYTTCCQSRHGREQRASL